MIIDWTKFPLAHTALELLDIVADNGFEARFVGGCVRDALLGVAAHDIDLATTANPQEMIALLKKAQIKYLPSGIAFGTLTVILDHTPLQVTSLREDWQTDGRHANVSFGTDWLADAQRRDFTINALYADRRGKVYDYFNSVADLEAGIVRFIGEPRQRIHEDYLRILRFFRFLARFAKAPPSPDTLEVLRCESLGLKILSLERVTGEILSLLKSPAPLQALAYMADTGVYEALFHTIYQRDTLTALLALEASLLLPPDPLRRLLALELPLSTLNSQLRLANHTRSLLRQVLTTALDLSPPTPQQYYYFGFEACVYGYLLRLSRGLSVRELTLAEARSLCQPLLGVKWDKPLLPIKGSDIQACGIESGPKIGHYLKACEKWWVELDFKPDHRACLAFVQEQIKQEPVNGI